LPSSSWLAAGYDLELIGQGERILRAAITQALTLTSSGAYEPLAPGSTKAVVTRRHHGIVRIERFSFPI
jgi:hypothetical protein